MCTIILKSGNGMAGREARNRKMVNRENGAEIPTVHLFCDFAAFFAPRLTVPYQSSTGGLSGRCAMKGTGCSITRMVSHLPLLYLAKKAMPRVAT